MNVGRPIGRTRVRACPAVYNSRYSAPPEHVDAIESDLRAETVVPRPAEPASVRLRDPDDAWVLASALNGEADLLVTGDQDLLDVADQVSFPILDPRGCWDRLRRID